jgi:hypothetical protein
MIGLEYLLLFICGLPALWVRATKVACGSTFPHGRSSEVDMYLVLN